jgi:cytochrome b561
MRLRNDRAGYGSVSSGLHWLIALVFLAQILLGVVMTRILPETAVATFWAYQWHKSFGLLLLLLSALRLVWVLVETRPVNLAGHGSALAAGVVHRYLLFAPILIAFAGWIIVSVSPLAVPTFAFNLFVVPHLPLVPGDDAERRAIAVHRWLAYGTAIVVAIHIAAALMHHFRWRDGTMARMLPRCRQSAGNDR